MKHGTCKHCGAVNYGLDQDRYQDALEKIYELTFQCDQNTMGLKASKVAYEALHPTPEMETLEVIRFECLTCGFIEPSDCTSGGMSPNKCCRSDARITLKGSYQVPARPKVKRREEIAFDMNFIEALVCGGQRIPLSAKYYAEWAE